jgi:alpha-beta hydrolase superfamily lysophospholipase
MPRPRAVSAALPVEVGRRDGLSYSLWLPGGGAAVTGGVVIVHGAGSCKENHHDYARAAIAAGFGAIAFDQRGHGASAGPLDGRAIEDVASMAGVLRAGIGEPAAPVALRGSSMGGYLAIVAAPSAVASAIVAVCPASGDALRLGIASGRLRFDCDPVALDQLVSANDLSAVVASLTVPLLLLHAEGDEQVPVGHSRELAARARSPASRLVVVPGGHHRSVQHDPELQAASLRFIRQAFAARQSSAPQG